MPPRQPPPKGIQAFMLRGAVPIESVGYVLKALYESGAGHLDIDPIVPLTEAPTIELPALPGHRKRLPLPEKRAAGLKGSMYRSDGKVNLKAYLEALIYKAKSISRPKLTLKAAQEGYARISVSARLKELVTAGSVATNGAGIYTPTGQRLYDKTTAAKVAKIKPNGKLPDPASINGICLAELKRVYPEKLYSAAIAKKLVAKGRRAEASSVALNWLKNKGLITGERDGESLKHLYQYIQQKEHANASAT